MKIRGRMGNGPRKISLNVDEDPDNELDPGMLF